MPPPRATRALIDDRAAERLEKELNAARDAPGEARQGRPPEHAAPTPKTPATKKPAAKPRQKATNTGAKTNP